MMEAPSQKYLKYKPKTVEVVKKSVNLDDQERLDEAVVIVEEWLKKQPHLVKKDFSREYIERAVISTKGSVERAKQKIDKICTLRTLMPEFFRFTNYTEEIRCIGEFMSFAFLPRLTKDYYRIYMMKSVRNDFDSKDLFGIYKLGIVNGEYLAKYDYSCGTELILDYRDINAASLVTYLNPITFRQALTIQLEGYSMRLKGAYILTESKMADMILSLIKQIVTAKIFERIHICKDLETLHQFVEKDILPMDYGGKEKSLKSLSDDWIEALSSEDFLKHLEEMNAAVTNEAFRPVDNFNEQYMGMPGTFRTLNVD